MFQVQRSCHMVITRAVMFRPADVSNDGHSQTATYNALTPV